MNTVLGSDEAAAYPRVHPPTDCSCSLVLSFSRVADDVDGAAAYLCRFQTEMKMSAPLPMGYPAGSPFSGAGSTSSASDLLIRIGGWGYMRRDSARAALTYGSFLRSSRSACDSACQSLLAPKVLHSIRYRKGTRSL